MQTPTAGRFGGHCTETSHMRARLVGTSRAGWRVWLGEMTNGAVGCSPPDMVGAPGEPRRRETGPQNPCRRVTMPRVGGIISSGEERVNIP